jgi:hypothetical protein
MECPSHLCRWAASSQRDREGKGKGKAEEGGTENGRGERRADKYGRTKRQETRLGVLQLLVGFVGMARPLSEQRTWALVSLGGPKGQGPEILDLWGAPGRPAVAAMAHQ